MDGMIACGRGIGADGADPIVLPQLTQNVAPASTAALQDGHVLFVIEYLRMSLAPFPIRKVSVGDAPIIDDEQVFSVALFRALGEVEAPRYDCPTVHDHHLVVRYGVLAVYPYSYSSAGQECCAAVLLRLLALVEYDPHRHAPVVCAFQRGGYWA